MFSRRLVILPAVVSLLFLLSFYSLSFSQNQTPVSAGFTYRGDINEDGQVNIFDLLGMLNILADAPASDMQRQIADMDSSGGVNIFDLLGMLQVLSGAEEPGIIYWGPVIAGVSPSIAGTSDTLTVYVENFEENITAADVKAYINAEEVGLLEFTLDSTLIIISEGFTGGDLQLVVLTDTTNSVYIACLVKVTGTVEQVTGMIVAELTVVSPMAEEKVEADGSFIAEISDSMEASFTAAVNQYGNPVLLSFMTYLPEAGLMGVKKKGGQVQLAATDNISMGIESTALSLIMLNPALIGSSAYERKTFAEKALQHSRFNELVTGITDILSADPNSNYLVDDSHPELFELANEIAGAVYDSLVAEGQLQMSGITDRPDPGIQVGASGKIEFTNPFYIYYGTGIYEYGTAQANPVFAQRPRSLRWGFVPYTGGPGDYGITEESITPDESLSVKINKGFDFDSPYWWNPGYPVGRGTVYNSGRIVLDLIDLVVKIPGLESKMVIIVDAILESQAIDKIVNGFKTGNASEVLSGFLDFIRLNSEHILHSLWQDAATDQMRNYVNLLHSVAGNVFKVLTVVQKVPFYVDLFIAPGEATYDFILQGGQVVLIEEEPDTSVIQGITMVSIPAGTFQMGSESGNSDEKPVHTVTITAFQMSACEITNAQYAGYLNAALAAGEITATTSIVTGATGDYSGQMYIVLFGSHDSNNKCWISFSNNTFVVESGKENWPVVYVTWYGAKAFSIKYDFDLPREAEWEYACRGGQQYEYGTYDGTISSTKANYNRNVGYPKDAGSYPKNPFGLYDMSGNVWEWCNDWYVDYSSENATDPQGPSTGSYRILRGGCWDDFASYCRSALRSRGIPSASSGSTLGFRVVRRVSSLQN